MKSTDHNQSRVMKCGGFKKLLFGAGLLALAAGACSAEETTLKVDRNMLLWKKNFKYRTMVLADISLTNSVIKVNLTDRSASGTQERSFHYHGSMAYHTELENDSTYNGSARRYYEHCYVDKSENNPLELKATAGWGEAMWLKVFDDLPPEVAQHVDVVSTHAWDGYLILRQKKGSDVLGGGVLERAFQSMEGLKGKWFLLGWNHVDDLAKKMVLVQAAEKVSGANQPISLVPTTAGVDPMVKDVLGRESKLLYEAMLGMNTERKAGDQWIVDGETLDAMVHPSVYGGFRGSLVVRAEEIKEESPDVTVDKMNGLRLKFVARGIINGRSHESNVRFVMATVDDGTHETKLTPADGTFSGEIWLDTENQCVRFGRIVVDAAKYDGFLPKIGKLNAKIKLKADLNFSLRYAQAITAREEN